MGDEKAFRRWAKRVKPLYSTAKVVGFMGCISKIVTEDSLKPGLWTARLHFY